MYTAPIIIDRAENTRGEIQLQKRDGEYEIISNGTFIMATYNGESERLLVKKAIEKAEQPKRVLIGGLGVGFSLATALAYPEIETVTVVEIELKMIEWNQSYLANYSNAALKDPRTVVIHADFTKWMSQTKQIYDVICLDIDNGPDWMMIDSNRSLYEKDSICLLKSLLTPTGVVAFWSATSSSKFVDRLQEVFRNVSIYEVPQEHGEPDYVFVASQ
ncbi:polyamine aminopropyltransferase [Paraliobacillus ryukyuensis]|uniref:Spermine/spermidine synthase n=1 Tax=Paraliobacillus ryukyuensis TaxID=200904 RepID=A0A366DYZ2_9BACI|nr:spermine/spermidine synthase [Paraliobacillus ryukyuensis]RBO95257.1 spermine/spermidine synthase [Paraliobacillus ryukyuensis]